MGDLSHIVELLIFPHFQIYISQTAYCSLKPLALIPLQIPQRGIGLPQVGTAEKVPPS